MSKTVLVLDPNKILYKASNYGLGALIIYDRLLQVGIDVELFNTTKNALNERDEMISEILGLRPYALCITTRCDTYPFCINLAERIKKKCEDIKIVFGGPHATLTCKQTFDFTKNIDVIVCGAGEGVIEQVIIQNFAVIN